MAHPPDAEQLEALKQLADVQDKLEKLVNGCLSREVTGDDEAAHDSLVREAQVLYGRVRSIVGTMVIVRAGMQKDTFQDVLGTPSIASFVNDRYAVGFWFDSLKASRSSVNQAIGRVEEMQRQGRLSLTPEVVSRYQRLIKALEWVRRAWLAGVSFVLTPFKFLDRLLGRTEKSPVVRIVILIGEIAAGVAVVAAVIAFVIGLVLIGVTAIR